MSDELKALKKVVWTFVEAFGSALLVGPALDLDTAIQAAAIAGGGSVIVVLKYAKKQLAVSKLTATQQDVAHNEVKDTPSHPNGWEPGVEFNYKTKTGTITTRAMDNASPEFNDLLRSWDSILTSILF